MSENFILQAQLDDKDLYICDELLEYFKSNEEHQTKGSTGIKTKNVAKVSTDLTIPPYTNNPLIQKYLKYLFSLAEIYTEKYSCGFFGLEMLEGFNIQHYAPNEGFFEWHNERTSSNPPQRALVWMTYLNDVDDGGETEFYYQNIKIKPVKGSTLIWPTDFTHTHRGVISPTQDKYITTGWFNHLQINQILSYALNDTKGFINHVKGKQ